MAGKRKAAGCPADVKTPDSDNQRHDIRDWNRKQSEETMLEIRKAGGIASGAARRAKADLVGYLRQAVEKNPEQIADVLLKIIQDDSRPTNQLKAFELLSKVLGLLSDNAQVTISNNVSFNTLDMSTLSDEELRRYADAQIVDAEND